MKTLKLILLLLLFAFNLNSMAQQELNATVKGSYFTNGSVLLNSTTHRVNDNKANSFAIKFNPKIAYFIIDNLAIGAEIAFSSGKDNQDGALAKMKQKP